jgi:hypothetical protein
MTEMQKCEQCQEEAEVHLAGPGGEMTYLCTSPECMMAAGVCPNCQVELHIIVSETGEDLYHCEQCDFERTYQDLGQP